MTTYDLLTNIVLALAFLGYVASLARARWITLGLTAALAAYIWQSDPATSATAHIWLISGVLVLLALWFAQMFRGLQPASKPTPSNPKRSKSTAPNVVVDGTNVIYWDGDPDLATLRAVVDALHARSLSPVVFFDASTRHHLKDTSLNTKGFARALGLNPDQINICPAGTEADAFLIKYARDAGVPIVSNDRFGDRAQQVKGIKRIKGVIAGGKPIFEGL